MSRPGFILWFGRSWNAPLCDPAYRRPLPLGERCGLCRAAIEDGDRGIIVRGAADDPTAFRYDLYGDGLQVWAVAQHIQCHLREATS